MEYGLIGFPLGHSYSPQIHAALGGYPFELCPLPTEEDARGFFAKRAFRGVNVTIPYKALALACCDEVDERAAAIGAVNTVVNRGGKLYGYNTDFDGFLTMLRRCGVSVAGKTVLILGTGSTCKTVRAVLATERAGTILCASRSAKDGCISYAQAAEHREVQIIINASPAGMYPHVGECLIDLGCFPAVEAVLDVVYNPFETALLRAARERNIPCENGLPMLVAQAKAAAEYYLGKPIDNTRIAQVCADIARQRYQLVLIGMPSCGKSALGRRLAADMHREFVDLDREIETRAGKPIAQIFAEDGEAAFRKLESELCAEYGKESGLVLATGGGAVLNPANVDALRQNGILLYLDRPLEQLTVGGARPLSTSAEALAALYAQRAPLYKAAAHRTVENNASLDEVCAKLKGAFDEIVDCEWA